MSGAKFRLKKAGADWWKQNISCLEACPAHTNVPGYIYMITRGKFEEAFELNRKANVFPAILGRICMHPCEDVCRRGEIDAPVAICALKRAAADHKPDVDRAAAPTIFRRKQRVAIVGGGPTGLTMADDLARIGYNVTVFEALPVGGGMLNVGIPPYRLDREVTQVAIKELERVGVEIRLNTPVGQDITLEQLQAEHDAVLIAAGAHEPIELGIPGEQLKGVLHGVTFMRMVNLGQELPLGRRVAVIGGGNTATDCARSALFLGAEEVTIVYRRTRAEMPVSAEEIEEALEEGVKIEFLVSPLQVIGDENGQVIGLECIRNRLSAPDASGRPKPIPMEGSEFILDVDTILPAVSQSPDTSFLPDVFGRTQWDLIEVDPKTFMTSVPGVFAGGDYITGPRHVISVIADGHRLSASIHSYLQGLLKGEKAHSMEIARMPHATDSNYDALPRQKIPTLPTEERKSLEEEVQLGFSRETAFIEAQRCLRCDVNIMIDSDRCIMCGGCVDVCPHDCIRMISLSQIEGDKEVMELREAKNFEEGHALIMDEKKCIRCGLCVRRCPTDAIAMERFEILNPVYY